jgi:GT2 family glycosyltransferase
MERDSNIIHMKRMDSWKKSNSWYYYEAIKYFNKFKKEFLGEGYLEAYKSFNVFSRFWSKLFRIKKGEGNINELETVYWKIDSGIYVEHPNYMSENNFQKAEFYFHENKLSYTNYKNLDFLLSLNFAEWLSLEGAAVATSRLEAIHGGATPERFRFSASSTGKYKSYKIGFRLCYLLK